MKCTTIIDSTKEEQVVIYVREKSRVTERIEEFVKAQDRELIGYSGDEIVRLCPSQIFVIATSALYILYTRCAIR